MNDKVLFIDPEFRRLLPELSADEMKQLEENILRDGCRDPIVIWKDTIIDGHHRYSICQKYKIPFKIENLDFDCREEVLRWICMNQVGRRNVSGVLLRYQIGKRYNVEKVLTAHNPDGKNQYSEVTSDNMMRPLVEKRLGTAASVGKAYNVSHFAVHTYKDIAKAVDDIATKDSRLSDLYLSGQMKIKKDDLMVLADMSEWQIRTLTNALIRQHKTICRSQDVLEALSGRDRQKENQGARERRKAAAMAFPTLS